MARVVRDHSIGTREARTRLKVRGKPYWRSVEPQLAIGYRRLAGAPGTWTVRRYSGGGVYDYEVIGLADDFSDADGERVLSFGQAQRKALEARQKAGPLTVAGAIASYLEHVAHKAGAYDARKRAEAHILPDLGDVLVAELTPARLRKWLNDLAATPARKRSKPGDQQYYALDASADGRRRREASANRTWVVLRAALNLAWRDGRVDADEWRKVRGFRAVNVARVRFLTREECARLINASDRHFRPLVAAALATACRFSELARLTAGDIDLRAGSVHIRTSKSGKARHVLLNGEGVALFGALCAGKGSGDLLFRMASGAAWGRSCQTEPMREACKRARITPAVGFHALRHTWASHAVMSGMALTAAAACLGHGSIAMISKHYGHLAPSFLSSQVQQFAPSFGLKAESNIIGLAGRS